jgi:SAM-dependent methyltransferase
MSEEIAPGEPKPAVDPHAHRFRAAAAHYLQGRPAYSPVLIADVALLCGLERTHRVMDLGCGPGQIALAFAPLAAEVVAVDPEPAMLAIASEQARTAGAANISCVAGSSETIGPALGRFRLVTIGRAFHWMNRARTLERLDALIEPMGAVALFGDRHVAEVPENEWHPRYRAIVDRYAAEDTTHPKNRAPGWWSNEAVLLDSPFARLERIAVTERRRTPVRVFVDRTLSMSSTAPDRLGEAKTGELVREVTELMNSLATDGLVTEVIDTHALIARRAG